MTTQTDRLAAQLHEFETALTAQEGQFSPALVSAPIVNKLKRQRESILRQFQENNMKIVTLYELSQAKISFTEFCSARKSHFDYLISLRQSLVNDVLNRLSRSRVDLAVKQANRLQAIILNRTAAGIAAQERLVRVGSVV